MSSGSVSRRVAITGIGAITALGPDAASFDRGLREGRCGVGPLRLFDGTGFRTQLAAEAPEPIADAGSVAPASRPDRFGVQAALEAVAQAGLSSSDLEAAA